MDASAEARALRAAQLWLRSGRHRGVPATGPAAAVPDEPRMIAGWEDEWPFCAAVCTTDVGLAFCRSCPRPFVAAALDRGRPAGGCCPAGVRLLAVPLPPGEPADALVLRVAGPVVGDAAGVARRVRVAGSRLRAAAAASAPIPPAAVRAAIRRLRRPAGVGDWLVEERERSADRRRAARAARAQVLATAEEFQATLDLLQQDRRRLRRSERQLDRIAREASRAAESERRQVAHQIHDTAAQSMASAVRYVQAAQRTADGPDERTRRHLEQAEHGIVTSIGEIRRVLGRLLPVGLEEFGLAAALRLRLTDLAADPPPEIALSGDLPRLQAWVEQTLFGMVAEAISNAVRHAGAGRVSVHLASLGDRAGITIDDDGIGFRPERVPATGLGIAGLHRQASWLGGRTTIRRRPAGGTRVRISIPLARHLADVPAGAPSPAGRGRRP